MKIRIETNLTKLPKSIYSVWLTDTEQNPLYSAVPDEIKAYSSQFMELSKRKKNAKNNLSYTAEKNGKITAGLFSCIKQIKYYSSEEKIKIAAAKAYEAGSGFEPDAVVFFLDTENGAKYSPEVIEGVMIKSYKFDKYKSSNDKSPDPDVILFVNAKDSGNVKKTVSERETIITSMNNSRDVINDQSRVVTPEYLVKKAKEIASKNKMKCEIFDVKRLKKEGYNGLITVGRGSSNPPYMIVMTYNPPKAKTKDHLCLIGKGLTFDTGGICLKPQSGMWTMKCDMTGAGVVLYAMEAIAKLKPQMKVSMIITTAENAIGPDATYPNEIFKAKNGKFVHVENTDAEGRLAMSDGLCHAGIIKATHIIDVATLTGSITVALGNCLDGIFGNDEEMLQKIVKTGNTVGETHHIMPIHEEYFDLIKHNVADINNIGSTNKGGAITAALFLREFVPEKTKWTHFDLAGVDIVESPWKYFANGATAIPLRTLVNLIMNWEK